MNMVYHTINEYFMKKISDFIPKKVIDKKENIDNLNLILNASIQANFRNKIRVINYGDTYITIECDDSSVASIMRFEKDKYLDVFNKDGMYSINELKVKVK